MTLRIPRISTLVIVGLLIMSAVLPSATSGLSMQDATVTPSTGSFEPREQNAGGLSNDVPMFRVNAARTGEMPGPAPIGPVEVFWTYDAGAPISYSSPSVVDGRVYIGATDGFLHAIDSGSGEALWTYRTGGRTVGTPAVADGRVFIGNDDGVLFAVDATTGELLWSVNQGDSIETSPLVVDGVVFSTGRSGNLSIGTSGNTCAFEVATGLTIWCFWTGDWIRADPSVENGIAYVSSFDRRLYALDASSGDLLWDIQTPDWVITAPVVRSGFVYFGDTNGTVTAFDLDSRTPKWSFRSGGGISSSLAVTDETIFFGSRGADDNDDGAIYAIDVVTGELVWRVETGDHEFSSPGVSESSLVVGGGNSVYALDPLTGEMRWSFPTGGSVSSSPVVTAGVVYVGSGDGGVYAIRSSPEGLQASAWKAYFENIGHVLSASARAIPGLQVSSVPSDPLGLNSVLIPEGFVHSASYPAEVVGGSGETTASLLIFQNSAEVDTAHANMTGGLVRSGWQLRDVEGLGHSYSCLLLAHSDSSQAVCYLARGDAMIVSISVLPVNAPDAVSLNAVDLARLMDDALDSVELPTHEDSAASDPQAVSTVVPTESSTVELVEKSLNELLPEPRQLPRGHYQAQPNVSDVTLDQLEERLDPSGDEVVRNRGWMETIRALYLEIGNSGGSIVTLHRFETVEGAIEYAALERPFSVVDGFSPVNAPRIGDQAQAFERTVDGVTGRILVVRIANLVIEVNVTSEYGLPEDPLDIVREVIDLAR